MMNDEVFQKNLELASEFSKHLLAHPELESEIPEGAQVLFLLESDPALSRKNLELGKKQREKGQPVVFVHVKGLRQEASRLIEPRLEKAAGL